MVLTREALFTRLPWVTFCLTVFAVVRYLVQQARIDSFSFIDDGQDTDTHVNNIIYAYSCHYTFVAVRFQIGLASAADVLWISIALSSHG